MSLREAAQQALEALEDSHQNINPERRYADELTRQIADSITALRAALAEPTSQESRQVEPVAYVTGYSKGRCTIALVDPAWIPPVGMALYRSPPKRKPLMEEEISKIFIYCGRDKETFSRAIERAHGIGGEE